MYKKVADEYRKENKVFGETMTKKSFLYEIWYYQITYESFNKTLY